MAPASGPFLVSQTLQRLQKLSRRGGEAWVADVAESHAHIDHLLGCYARRASTQPLNMRLSVAQV